MAVVQVSLPEHEGGHSISEHCQRAIGSNASPSGVELGTRKEIGVSKVNVTGTHSTQPRREFVAQMARSGRSFRFSWYIPSLPVVTFQC